MRLQISALIFLILLTGVAADIVEDVEAVRGKIEDFIDDPDNVVIVEGDHVSATERAAIEYLHENFPKIAAARLVKESELTDADREKMLFLVGGPVRNDVSAAVLEGATIISQDRVGLGIVTLLEQDGQRFVVFSDYKGFDNARQTAAEKSPLAKFLPVAYVPAAATAIGFSFLWFWEFIRKFSLKVLRKILSHKVMERAKKKEIKEHFRGFHVKGVRFKIREGIAVVIAATVFAVSLSYMYLSPDVDMLLFFVMTSVVNVGIYGMRHSVRLYLDKHFGLHTEYVVWPGGAIMTALTSWLGNTFALAGYMIKGHKEDTGHEGIIAFHVNLLTFVAFFLLWWWNYKNPHIMVQMASLLALAIGYIQMLPFSPFAGKQIYKWKKWLWWLMFIPATGSYILVNLLI